jgi:flagellar biogenesis protein FliO
MARNEQDPAASTQQFRAFANRGEAAQKSSNPAVIVGVVVGLIFVIAVIAFLALS